MYFVIPRVGPTSDNLTVGMMIGNNSARFFLNWSYKVRNEHIKSRRNQTQ